MEIVSITKLNNKYKIELSNDKNIYVSENTIIEFNIISKGKITLDTLKKIQKFEYREKAFNLALNYLSYGSRTEKEITEYLIKKEIPEEDISYAITKLIDYKYIDDEEYAILYIKDKLNINKKGPYYIKNKLVQKGISQNIIDKKLSEIISEEILIDNALNIISKEFSRKNYPEKKRIQKITTKLYTNGYSFDIINKSFEIFFEDNPKDDTDSEIIGQYFKKAYSKISRKYDDKYIIKQKIIEKLMRDGFSYDNIKIYFEKIEF